MRRREPSTHAWDRLPAGSLLRTRVSIHREGAPAGGFVDPPFRWLDVMDGDRPGPVEHGPPVYCLPNPEILSVGLRIEHVVLVHMLGRGRVEVEDGLFVTRRALAPAIESEREIVGRKLEKVQRRAQARASDAEHPVAEALHRSHARLARGARTFTRGLVAVPDRVANRVRRAGELLSTPEGRARVRNGMTDPTDLTREEKGVTLTVGLAGVLLALVLLHFAVTLAAPDLARPWRTVFLLFLYAFVTSLGLPLPIEPVLLTASLGIGVVGAIVTTVAAKVVAAWMVFFVGDEINDKLRKKAERSPRLARFLDRSETFARRFGLVAVAAFIATPGLPDVVALYIFGSLHMRLWKFLLGVAIGGTILYTAVTMGFFAFLDWV